MPLMDAKQQKMGSLQNFLLKASYYGEYNYLDTLKKRGSWCGRPKDIAEGCYGTGVRKRRSRR